MWKRWLCLVEVNQLGHLSVDTSTVSTHDAAEVGSDSHELILKPSVCFTVSCNQQSHSNMYQHDNDDDQNT